MEIRVEVWENSCWLLRLKLSRVKLYFRFACKPGGDIVINFCFCSLSKGIFNALKKGDGDK